LIVSHDPLKQEEAKMKSRTRSTSITACLIALCALGAAAFVVKPAVVANDKDRFEFGSEVEHPFGDTPVKGAAFSAQVVVENNQTLANGVHVAQKLTGALYRDTEGRTRQELPRSGSPELVLINDSAGGVLYHLNVFQHTAVKVSVDSLRVNREVEERHQQREHQEREHMERAKAIAMTSAGRELEPQRKVESLGVQTFEGVPAEVTRFTVTIPAGMEGNDQPFDIVSERWYSPDLQILLMGKRSDPRTGEMTYRLTNISRAEPARSLFEAPADFTIKEERVELRKKEKM
jgi:hypothetical protein